MKSWVVISKAYIWKGSFREVKVQRAERRPLWPCRDGQVLGRRLGAGVCTRTHGGSHSRLGVLAMWSPERLSRGLQAQCYFRMIFLVDVWIRDRDKMALAGWIGWGNRQLERPHVQGTWFHIYSCCWSWPVGSQWIICRLKGKPSSVPICTAPSSLSN